MPRKQELIPEIKTAITTGWYDLTVQLTIHSSVFDQESRETASRVDGRILFFLDPESDHSYPGEDGAEEGIEIGYISAWRVTGWMEPQELVLFADEISQDLFEAVHWLVYEQKFLDHEEIPLSLTNLCFIRSVVLEEAWRGFGFALPSVATFLDLLSPSLTFFKVCPLDLPDDASASVVDRKTKALIKYWKRLGLEQWSDEPYLAATYWECPKKLSAEVAFDQIYQLSKDRDEEEKP